MYAYKNEAVRKKILSVRKLTNFSYSNYRIGQDAQPIKLELSIPDSSRKVIEDCRSNAIADGILRDENKQEVPAQLFLSNDTFDVKLRLKGDYSDHWAGEKWSYRIDLNGDDRIFGMKSFSVQDPATRGFLNEWYFHKLLREENLIALRYSFVTVVENGVEKGIYAVEESFDKNLIEFNRRREAPILKFDESIWIDNKILNEKGTYSQENLFLMSDIGMFSAGRTLKDPVLYDQFQKGRSLLQKLRDRQIPLSEAMDVDRAARLTAIADLAGAHHALRWKNVRFYYNPVNGKLELIGFDSNSGKLITDIYYNLWSENTLGMYVVRAWKAIFWEDPEFVNCYFKYLEKFGNPQYLKTFHKKIEAEMNLYLSYLYKENSTYEFSLDIYKTNAALILEKAKKYKESRKVAPNEYFVRVTAAAPLNSGDLSITLIIKNNSFQPIRVLGIYNSSEQRISANSEFEFDIPGRTNGFIALPDTFVFQMNSPLDSNCIELKSSKYSTLVHKKIKVGYLFPGQEADTNFTKIEHYYKTDIQPHLEKCVVTDAFEIDHGKLLIRVKNGKWVIRENISTPTGYTLLCGEGSEIDIRNSACFTVHGPLEMIGSAENPIRISSSDSSGSFLVYGAYKRSQLKHVVFDHLNEAHHGRWHLTGAVTFYESDVSLENVTFMNNKGEDALNIFRSDLNMKQCTFLNTNADAFDGDFCTGSIDGLTFDRIGNDAIDFSGSVIRIKNVSVTGAGDKAVSAGERSTLYVENIEVKNSQLGLVSKDNSFLQVRKATLSNVAVGFIVFKKKGVFGPARIVIDDYTCTEFIEDHLIELGSYAILNGKSVAHNQIDVLSILYGNKYGKASK